MRDIDVCIAQHHRKARPAAEVHQHVEIAVFLIVPRRPCVAAIAVCAFPWFGVAGCWGKDTAAMLRLTVSDDIELRSRLSSVPGWYVNVRKSYGGKPWKTKSL